mmetsp:Transcript_49539/g.152382  ORF Transcript_49539/g.152382 Transcript_49539/m.152382 type:complete len:215 (-) Transcript_49539:2-646(-)
MHAKRRLQSETLVRLCNIASASASWSASWRAPLQRLRDALRARPVGARVQGHLEGLEARLELRAEQPVPPDGREVEGDGPRHGGRHEREPRGALLHDAVAKGDVGRQPCQPLLQPGRDDLARLRVDGRARLQHVLHLRAPHDLLVGEDPDRRVLLPRVAEVAPLLARLRARVVLPVGHPLRGGAAQLLLVLDKLAVRRPSAALEVRGLARPSRR